MTRILQTVAIFALAVAPIAATAAPALVRPSAPIVWPHGFGARHVVWRGGEGDRDVLRRRPHDFIGAVGPTVGEATEPGAGAAPSPLVVAAPVTVNVTFTPAGAPPLAWSDGPKLIEIGRSAPPHRRLPLVVYGD